MKRKFPFVAVLFLFSLHAYSQDTIYFDAENKKVVSIQYADFYKVSFCDSSNLDVRIERFYYKYGKMKSENFFKKSVDANTNKISWKKNGLCSEWNALGQLQKQINYLNGRFNGSLTTFWDNGNVKRKDQYALGKFVEGKCYDMNGKTIKFYPYEKMPSYGNSDEAMNRFIGANLIYPEQSKLASVEGKVIVQFTVNKNGSIANPKVIRMLDPYTDAEAIRIVKLMTFWSPAMINGDVVDYSMTLPFTFKLQR